MQTIPMALTVIGLFIIILVILAFILPDIPIITANASLFPASLALFNNLILPLILLAVILVIVMAYYTTGG